MHGGLVCARQRNAACKRGRGCFACEEANLPAWPPRLQLAEHHYRLGEVYWKMRGRYRSETQFAYTQVGWRGGGG